MSKGSVSITKKKYREFKKNILDVTGEDTGGVILKIFYDTFGFDENALSYDKYSKYEEVNHRRSNIIIEHMMQKELLKRQLVQDVTH